MMEEKKEYTLETKGNHITCSHCGLDLEIDEHYSFKENEYNIKDVSDWYTIIEKYENKNIEKGVNLECKVNVKKYNFKNYTCQEGEGICNLSNDQFSFVGNVEGDLSFDIPMSQLSALAFSANEEFECYYNEELYYFYPVENAKQCVKWALIVDEMNKEVSCNG